MVDIFNHEIGLRIALEAYRFDVLRLGVGESVAMAIVGVAVGIGASFGLTRLLAKMLYGVSAHDPITFAACGVLLVSVALAVSCVPARRNARRSGCSSASRIDFSRVNSG